MADIPEAPKEGTSTVSSSNVPMLFLVQDDGAGGLQATLLSAVRSETVNGQLLGDLAVALTDVQEITLLASAARTATASSADITNLGYRGVMLTLDVTVDPAGASIELSIEYKEPVAGNYETLFSAAAAVTAVGTHTYVLYPGDIVAADDVVEVGKLPLPATWRVTITHADADSMTYSVSGSTLI